MKRKKLAVAAVLACAMGLLGGCSRFDAVAYTQAVLDVSYKNQTEKYIEQTEATPEEAEAVFQNNLEAAMEGFKTMKLPGELEDNYRTLFEDIIKNVKYTVGEAKKEEDGSYTVDVSVEPITLFDDTYAAFQAKAEEYAAGITDSVMNGAEMPADEEIQQEVYKLYYEILRAELDAGVKYGKAEETAIHIVPAEDGTYEIKKEDLRALDEKLISREKLEE